MPVTFEESFAVVQSLGKERGSLGRQIDALVYDLYSLTDNDFKIVEGGSK
ncbi:MAG TPA: hypothetical protein VMR33_05270 [Candidatus Baltobacteraceae bacterium]|jgi:hypothetical protein|nr:hypothetical protein [Candidatus Baltobacteraceae bacterium]